METNSGRDQGGGSWKCPSCGLQNLPLSSRCDCGHDPAAPLARAKARDGQGRDQKPGVADLVTTALVVGITITALTLSVAFHPDDVGMGIGTWLITAILAPDVMLLGRNTDYVMFSLLFPRCPLYILFYSCLFHSVRVRLWLRKRKTGGEEVGWTYRDETNTAPREPRWWGSALMGGVVFVLSLVDLDLPTVPSNPLQHLLQYLWYPGGTLLLLIGKHPGKTARAVMLFLCFATNYLTYFAFIHGLRWGFFAIRRSRVSKSKEQT